MKTAFLWGGSPLKQDHVQWNTLFSLCITLEWWALCRKSTTPGNKFVKNNISMLQVLWYGQHTMVLKDSNQQSMLHSFLLPRYQKQQLRPLGQVNLTTVRILKSYSECLAEVWGRVENELKYQFWKFQIYRRKFVHDFIFAWENGKAGCKFLVFLVAIINISFLRTSSI